MIAMPHCNAARPNQFIRFGNKKARQYDVGLGLAELIESRPIGRDIADGRW